MSDLYKGKFAICLKKILFLFRYLGPIPLELIFSMAIPEERIYSRSFRVVFNFPIIFLIK